MKRSLCVLLCLLMCLTALLAGCGESEESSAPAISAEESKGGTTVTEKDIRATDLLENITARQLNFTAIERPYHPLMSDLAVKLAQQAQEKAGEDNMLISPLSILYAMAMVSGGADDAEAVKRFWGGVDMLHINEFMSEYQAGLTETEKSKLQIANSVWFTDKAHFTVNRDFLQTIADYYEASAFAAPFDQQTCKDINNWVDLHTDGMVKDVLDRIPEDAVMYLVNTLAFEAEWQEPYGTHQVREGIFHTADGSEQKVQMMHGEDAYLEDELATGFRKYYHGNYSFVAMLPKEGVSVEEYLASLTGDTLHTLLTSGSNGRAFTVMPQFETTFNLDMREALKAIGYPMDGSFNGVGTSTEGPIEISRVLHKTYITLGPQGTKAGAATVVEMKSGSMPEYVGTVELNRPFVYMIVDNSYNIPLFIGTVKGV